MKNTTKKLNKWVLLLILTVTFGLLLMLAIATNTIKNDGTFLGGLIRSEIYALIAIFLVLLLVLLLILLLAMSNGKNKNTIAAIKSSIKQRHSSQNKQPTDQRFCMLNEIDSNSKTYSKKEFDQEITLESLCEDFKNYAASELSLYYNINDIRRFVAGLATSKLIILQGMSGTGKTSLAHAFGSFINNSSTIIPVQPMWKERTDLIGYYNEFTKKFNESPLLIKMYEANYSNDVFITVLDEMNIARVEYYFAEFLSLLELPNSTDRYINVVSDKWDNDPKQFVNGSLKLPENMWFVGTANNDDSTFAISDKVYDRAMIVNLDSKNQAFEAPHIQKRSISAEKFNSLVDKATNEYEISQQSLANIEALDKYLIEHFHVTFGNRIMKQIKTFVPVFMSCGGNETDAIDDILSKKIIRKLESQNPIYLRNSAEGLINFIDEVFGYDNMPLCKEHINKLLRNT